MDKDRLPTPDDAIPEMSEFKAFIHNCGEIPTIIVKSRLTIKCINTAEEISVPDLSEFLACADRIESPCVKSTALPAFLNSGTLQRLVACFSDSPKLTEFIPKDGIPFEITGPGMAKNRIIGSLEFFDNCRLVYDAFSPRVRFEIKTELAFMPDPKSLWKDIPCSSDLVFFKENNVFDYARTSFGRTVIGASRRGRSHAHLGNSRDDDFLIGKDIGPWTLMVVCDGAGSAQYSRKGSETACRLLADICRQEIANENSSLVRITTDISKLSEDRQNEIENEFCSFIAKAISRILEATEKEAQGVHSEVRDFATTLLFSLTRKTGSGYLILSFSVGDGAIAVFSRDIGSFRLMNQEDYGDYAGETRFISSLDPGDIQTLKKRINIHFCNDFDAVMLMTDGITEPKFETGSELEKWCNWDKLWMDLTQSGDDHINLNDEPETNARRLVSWMNFWVPGCYDDRTIVIMY